METTSDKIERFKSEYEEHIDIILGEGDTPQGLTDKMILLCTMLDSLSRIAYPEDDRVGLNVTEGAKVLGVARHTLSRVINGRSGISPDRAIRLEKAGWSNADHWVRLQGAYELAQARKHEDDTHVERFEVVEAPSEGYAGTGARSPRPQSPPRQNRRFCPQ